MARIVIRLARAEKRRIVRGMRSTKDAEFRARCRIVLLFHEGRGSTTIARTVGCAPATAVRVADRFRAERENGLVDHRKENGAPKVDADILEALVRIIQDTPESFGFFRPTWTQELLARALALATGVRVSQRTIGRMLADLGARWGAPRPVVYGAIPEELKGKRFRAIRRKLAKLPKDEVIAFVDEVDIDLNPKIGPDWMLPCQQKTVVTPGKNQKRYIAGALDARTGDVTWVVGERKNSDLFIALLGAVRKKYPRARRFHFVLDNYSIHSSRRTKMAAASSRVPFVLHFLAPYSPQYNAIERLWKQLHDNVTRNHTAKNIEALMEQVTRFLRRASPFPGSQPSLASIWETQPRKRAAS